MGDRFCRARFRSQLRQNDQTGHIMRIKVFFGHFFIITLKLFIQQKPSQIEGPHHRQSYVGKGAQIKRGHQFQCSQV